MDTKENFKVRDIYYRLKKQTKNKIMAFYMKMGSKSLKASGINMNGSPLEVNCPDGTPPPCSQPGQAAADAAAEKSVDNANRVYNDDFKETGNHVG